jgi:predicted small lipoprotein YifL
MRSLITIAILTLATACGSEDDLVLPPAATTAVKMHWTQPEFEKSTNPIAASDWNCGLRAVAALRAASDRPWDPAALERQTRQDLPLRAAGAWEGMSTNEVALVVQRAGLRSRTNLSTAFDDIWEASLDGDPSILLVEDGVTRVAKIATARGLHWIAVVGIGLDAEGRRGLIVLNRADDEPSWLGEDIFRSILWWHADGFTAAFLAGAGVRPGTSLRVAWQK